MNKVTVINPESSLFEKKGEIIGRSNDGGFIVLFSDGRELGFGANELGKEKIAAKPGAGIGKKSRQTVKTVKRRARRIRRVNLLCFPAPVPVRQRDWERWLERQCY